MIAAIVTAEIAFWVLLVGGLALRYLLRARRVSTIVLAAVPLVDLVLVAFVAVDIARGAPADRAHGLAAIYLGFTVAFGHSLIRSVDARFKHRFAGGPKPEKPAKGSREEVRASWAEWRRVVLAAAVASAGLLLLIALDGRPVPDSIGAATGDPYWSLIVMLGMVTGIWFLAGPAFARTKEDAGRA